MASLQGESAVRGDGRQDEQPALRRYLDTIKERWWFVVLAVVICTAAATVYAMTASKVYEASADMLVTPVPDDQTAVLGLGLLRKATDPTRDVTTASLMIDNTSVAQRVQRDLRTRRVGGLAAAEGSRRSGGTEQHRFDHGVGRQSTPSPADRQCVRARGGDRAHRPAASRTRSRDSRRCESESDRSPAIRLRRPATAATQPLYQQLAALEALRSAPDPTLRVETPATAPTSPSSPRVKLSLAAGVIAGLLIGIAGAFALRVLDPRSNREDRLDAMGLSVLTRVPNLTRSSRSRHAFDESFRFLRTMLRFAADEPIPTIAVTSTSEREGKTTTSFQLAMATLEAGQTVMLVEADPYRPGLTALIESAEQR